MADRRTFLRGLASLPLIGGSVALIGSPSAAAVPVTDQLMDSYSKWLYFERKLLMIERYGQHRAAAAMDFVPMTGPEFHFPCRPADWRTLPQPSTRAAVVLATVGCPVRGRIYD